MSESPDAPIYWHDAEPRRYRRDLDEVANFAPDLVFTAGPGKNPVAAHQGVWLGRLPRWPFDRPEPDGLVDLAPEGLVCAVWCSPAHPMLPPQVVPLVPEPEIGQRSQHTWHISPDGSLCLMQTLGAWPPETSIVDLLVRAAAWRIEYALMEAGTIEEMTERGIVYDDSLDRLIGEAGRAARAAATEKSGADGEQVADSGSVADDADGELGSTADPEAAA